MSIEAMKQALEALEIAADAGGVNFYEYAKDLRQAIAEAEKQEPVAHQPWCASMTQMLTSMPPKPAPCDCKVQCVEHGECFGGKCIHPQPKPEQEPEAAPVAKNEGGRITWIIDDWPQNCLLYTNPPKSFTYEQVKAHIRAASMSANDIVVGSDITDDGISIVIRRRDEVLYAEFFAHKQPKREPLTEKEFEVLYYKKYGHVKTGMMGVVRIVEAAHGIKGEV